MNSQRILLIWEKGAEIVPGILEIQEMRRLMVKHLELNY
jgi:hypothetical protein